MALQGNIDHADREELRGWVRDAAAPETPVSLLVTAGSHFTVRVLANIYRVDLEKAGLGFGRHGYVVPLDGLSPLESHTVHLVREEDGEALPGSPVTIPARPRFDAQVQDYLAAMLTDTADDAELLARSAFLAQQADRLLQARADRRAALAFRHFRARWTGSAAAASQPNQPRALVIDDALPGVDHDAGSSAVVSHMRSLQRLGFSVVFAPADTLGGPNAVGLTAAGIATCHSPWTGSVEEVLRRETGSFALVYLHRASNTRYLPLVRYHQPRARLVYSVADLHHVRLARQAEVEQRPDLAELSQSLRGVELSAASLVDAVITHSSFEAALLRREAPRANVHVLPWSVAPRQIAVPFTDRRGLAFIGSYSHPPNLDAAWWLLHDILPMVRARHASIECLFAGSDMPDSLRAAERPGVRMLGHVPNLADFFSQVRLSVAPLAFGAGAKGKVLESLAAGLPCACTPLAAEGLDFPPALQAMVAEAPGGLAETIVRLHEDAACNALCSEAGLSFIAADWSQTRLDMLMQAVVRPAAT